MEEVFFYLCENWASCKEKFLAIIVDKTNRTRYKIHGDTTSLGGSMVADTSGYMAQVTFFHIVEISENNQKLLAQVALGLSDQDDGMKIQISQLMSLLSWDERQALLSVLALRSNTRLSWAHGELIKLMKWASSELSDES